MVFASFSELAKDNLQKRMPRVSDPWYWENQLQFLYEGLIYEFYKELQSIIQDDYKDTFIQDAISNKRKEYILRFLRGFNPSVKTQFSDVNLNRISKGLSEQQAKGFARQMLHAGIDLRTLPYAGDKLNEFVFNNTQRIQSLLAEEVQAVYGIIEGQPDLSRKELSKMIREETRASAKKAKLIATNEVLTLQKTLDHVRQKAMGFTKFMWNTLKDQRVRESHQELDGQIFSFNDLPVRNGERVYPGSPTKFCINCRCYQTVVL